LRERPVKRGHCACWCPLSCYHTSNERSRHNLSFKRSALMRNLGLGGVACFPLLTAVQKRTYLATKIANFHGCKRETAVLATITKCIAPPPRQGSATPGCKRLQPALDPAPGLSGVTHFSCPKKAHRHVVADLDNHSHPQRLARAVRPLAASARRVRLRRFSMQEQNALVPRNCHIAFRRGNSQPAHEDERSTTGLCATVSRRSCASLRL